MTDEEDVDRKTAKQIAIRRDYFSAVLAIMELEREVLKATSAHQMASLMITAADRFKKVSELNLAYAEVLTNSMAIFMIHMSKGDPS